LARKLGFEGKAATLSLGSGRPGNEAEAPIDAAAYSRKLRDWVGDPDGWWTMPPWPDRADFTARPRKIAESLLRWRRRGYLEDLLRLAALLERDGLMAEASVIHVMRARAGTNEMSQAEALQDLALAEALRGRLDRALALNERAVRLLRKRGCGGRMLARALYNRALHYVQARDPVMAEKALRDFRKASQLVGAGDRLQPSIASARALAMEVLGDHRQAVRAAAEAVAAFRRSRYRNPYRTACASNVLAYNLFGSGNVRGALEALTCPEVAEAGEGLGKRSVDAITWNHNEAFFLKWSTEPERIERALQLERKVVTMLESDVDDSEMLARSRLLLAELILLTPDGRIDEAERMRGAVARQWRGTRIWSSLETAYLRTGALADTRRGKPGRAIKKLRAVRRLLAFRQLPPNHPVRSWVEAELRRALEARSE
jgi:tetratricopeptide (TPR) repeat protein